MKIRQHPRMQNVQIDDEIYLHSKRIFAHVIEVFPAAACVKIGMLSLNDRGQITLHVTPELWRADDIENLSTCRCCGAREHLLREYMDGIPFCICEHCLNTASDQHHHHSGVPNHTSDASSE
ncbi:MAG: hypothetical protein GFH23_1086718n37 [Chloroflexi bacterium AL-N1]|nr:hypothetical protein [Chloroflexi bacterium AL-N1]NOK77308.1 hypothetical protein [Chloroflexi bacterium AL-N5]